MGNKDKTVAEYLRAMMGLEGATDIDDTDTHTANYWRVYVTHAAVFTTNTLVDGAAEAFGGSTIPVGTEIIANFTAIDLASGHVVATKY